MNRTKPKVLIVEDNVSFQKLLTDACETFADVLVADDLDKAIEEFVRQSGISAVVVDGNLLNETSGVDMVKFLKEQEFSGPIVAMSTDPDVNDAMLAEGATHKIGTNNKLQAITIVKAELSQ